MPAATKEPTSRAEDTEGESQRIPTRASRRPQGSGGVPKGTLPRAWWRPPGSVDSSTDETMTGRREYKKDERERGCEPPERSKRAYKKAAKEKGRAYKQSLADRGRRVPMKKLKEEAPQAATGGGGGAKRTHQKGGGGRVRNPPRRKTQRTRTW
jgi:hypothetical protein